MMMTRCHNSILVNRLMCVSMTNITGRQISTNNFASTSNNARASLFAAGFAIACSAVALSPSRTSTSTESKGEKLDVYLMDRIAKKPYLNYHDVPLQSRRYNRGRSRDEDDFKDASPPKTSSLNQRPKGVPSRLRILTIDVTQFKEQAFEDGVCQLPSEIFDGTNGPIFKDGIAPPKRMGRSDNIGMANQTRREVKESRKPIEQKSLAQRLYYCYDPRTINRSQQQTSAQKNGKRNQTQQPSKPHPKIGVEILEASIHELNPNNIRRTYTSKAANQNRTNRKSYKYDPGKYSLKSTIDGDSADKGADVEEAYVQDNDAQTTTHLDKDDEADEDSNPHNQSNDRTAPWNQYAWLEEMHLRVGTLSNHIPCSRCNCISTQKRYFLHYTRRYTVKLDLVRQWNVPHFSPT